MNAAQINTAIIQGNFTNEELNSLLQAVKYSREKVREQVKAGLRVGDNASWVSGRNGQTMTGVVTKIAIKYVTLRTVEGLWRVPANMLTSVPDEQTYLTDFNSVGASCHY